MCAHQNPRVGLCGSCGRSEKAWCTRWVATHLTGPPCKASVPHTVRTYSSHFGTWKLRCAKRRWKHTVMPKAVMSCSQKNTQKALQVKVNGAASAPRWMIAMPARISHLVFVRGAAIACAIAIRCRLLYLHNDKELLQRV